MNTAVKVTLGIVALAAIATTVQYARYSANLKKAKAGEKVSAFPFSTTKK